MGDEEIGQLEFLLQILHQVDDLRLDGDIERGDRLVRDDQLRSQGERARDADTLPLAATELVRVAVVEVRIQADDLQQLLDPLVLRPAAQQAEVLEWLGDDIADGHPRIQGRVGVLEDHLQLAAVLPQFLAPELGEVDAVEKDVPGRHRQQLGDQPSQR